jgi:hypothetical protein
MELNRRQYFALVGTGLWSWCGMRHGWAAEPAIAPMLASLPEDLLPAWRQARLQGAGQLRFLGLLIYEARLWVQPGWAAERFAQTPLVLELIYSRSLSGAQIAERSLKEMKGVGRVTPEQAVGWLTQMKALFPDVKANDRISGLLRPGKAAQFFLNGKLLGEVVDAEFAELFFGIWLSPQTSEPKLRQSLIGAVLQPLTGALNGHPLA